MSRQQYNGSKPSPLGPIPIDWDCALMQDIAAVTRLAGYEYSEYWSEAESGEILALKGENIGINEIIRKNLAYISNALSMKLNRSRLYKNDIVFPCVGTIGNAYVVRENDKYHINQNIAKISPNQSRINSFFLAQYLMSDFCKNEIRRFNATTSQPNVLVGSLRAFRLLVPPVNEQTKIAELLKKWDIAIEKITQLIAAKEQRKKWLMQQLLTGKKRLTGFTSTWREVKMSDIFDRVARRNVELNSTVVTISAQRGFVSQGDYFNKIVASDILDNYFLVHKGEFCYNKSYSNGYPWGATKRLNDFEKAVVTTLYICFGIKDYKRNSGEFFEHFFESGILDEGLMKIAHEGGRAHGLLNVTPTDFFNLKITVPEIKEQIAIANILQTADKEIGLLKLKLSAYKEQKKGLMQVLLTGKVRLKLK